MDNEKTQLMIDIDALQIKHRDISDLTLKATADLHLLEDGKIAITAEIARLKGEFNTINNTIANEKLEWLQQKTKEENELEEKKKSVSDILKKEEDLNKLAIELETKKSANQSILNTSNKVLDEAQKEKVASQVLVNQSNVIQLEAEELSRKSNEKIAIFKQKLISFHENIIEEFN